MSTGKGKGNGHFSLIFIKKMLRKCSDDLRVGLNSEKKPYEIAHGMSYTFEKLIVFSTDEIPIDEIKFEKFRKKGLDTCRF